MLHFNTANYLRWILVIMLTMGFVQSASALDVKHPVKSKTQKIRVLNKAKKVVQQKKKTTTLKKTSVKDSHIIQQKVIVKKTQKISIEPIRERALTEAPPVEEDDHLTDSPTDSIAAVVSNATASWFTNSFQPRLVGLVKETVSTLRYSDYKLGGSRFDTKHGVYVVDCSSYVDHLLQTVNPEAYSKLVSSTGAEKPTTLQYFDFFSELSPSQNAFWNRVNDVEDLRAGDILVFRFKNHHRGARADGHVMIVMDKPMRDTDVFFVRVADSAPSRHSQDTRQAHEGGIGIGTLLLKVDATGHPAAYAWGVGGYWNKNVNFAMGRPLESGLG